MNTKNDGGSAFPTEGVYKIAKESGRIVAETQCSQGMSLRDWFAGQILNGIVASGDYAPVKKHEKETWPERYARIAYEMADAMLAEREKTDAKH